MPNINIERNTIDYILTDTLPYELPELFSLYPFYEFLCDKHKTLTRIRKLLQNDKSNNLYMFNDGSWSTTPLKYKISKGIDDKRVISLINPLSILSIYFFIELYQKELLIEIKDNNDFSLRYHTRNSELYYKRKISKGIEYFSRNFKNSNKSMLQQTGIFYRIQKYNSINEFTSSKEWNLLNFEYKYFSSIDYKSCFDSIYSHSFKWIIEKDVIDSISAKNSSLFITIDRLSQNINGKSSNGLPVGPEFSRMIAEILLKEIDFKVRCKLDLNNIIYKSNYKIYRYVDDIFIFAESELIIDKIIDSYRDASTEFNLNINELKITRKITPFITSLWINRVRRISDSISDIFNRTNKNFNIETECLLKDGYIPFDRYLDEIKSVICDFPENKKQIVSYLLSTIYNQISKKKEGFRIFNDKNINKFSLLLEMTFYVFSYHVSFDHAQKLLSIISYINSEADIINNESYHIKFQQIITNYSFIFDVETFSDISNLLMMVNEFKCNLPSKIEESLERRVVESKNPINLALLLVYSQYNKNYSKKILSIIENILLKEIDILKQTEQILLSSSFWFIIIFVNCNYLDSKVKKEMKKILSNLRAQNISKANPVGESIVILCDFMLQNEKNLFFSWGYCKFSLTKQIAFRTYQRTIFKNYRKKGQLGYEGSLD